jgi:hypothetical protein
VDAKFISIVQRLVNEQGKEALINAAKAKPLLGDYSKNEFKKERHLLLIAIEAGAAKEIANATDLEQCKKIQIRHLCEERFINDDKAVSVIDLLAYVLCGDRNKSTAVTQPRNNYNFPPIQTPPPQPQDVYTPPIAPQYDPPQPQNSPIDQNANAQANNISVSMVMASAITGAVVGVIVSARGNAIVGAFAGVIFDVILGLWSVIAIGGAMLGAIAGAIFFAIAGAIFGAKGKT